MNGSEIFSFTLTAVPSLVRDTLEKNKTAMEAVDLFIFHQANVYMLECLRKKLKIAEEKFYACLWDVGNTVSSTIPIAICESLQDGSLKKGMKALLAGFGVGYSWGGSLLSL
jgi:3-oxoacyl-[acyl-carrier-protein] synthase-3